MIVVKRKKYGYQKLLAAVQADEAQNGDIRYRNKFNWVIERVEQYAAKTGLAAADILDAWEAERDYWYMNYYQEMNQPSIDSPKVRVFQSTDELLTSIGKLGFRCPKCERISRSPYECSLEDCDWKVYGLFGHMGKGVFVYVKDSLRGENLFMPVAWEPQS